MAPGTVVKRRSAIGAAISLAGMPVFAADIKGDLSGIAAPGDGNEKLLARTKKIGQDWQPQGCPVEFYSLGGGDVGVPLRATVTSFGPILLSYIDLISMGVSIVVILFVAYFLLRTRIGKATRAISDNPQLASASGINVDRVPGPRGPVTYRDLWLRQFRVVGDGTQHR